MEWQDYLDPAALETLWQEHKPLVSKELAEIYGIHTPPAGYTYQYWQHRMTTEWRRWECLAWLMRKSGRIIITGTSPETLLNCTKIHLEACLLASEAI